MAGAGWRDFVPGEVLTAANVQDYLQDQAVMVFASSAARTSAISSPSEGMVSYLTDTNRVEVYTGSAWQSYTAGLIPISPTSVAQSGGSASANTLGLVTFSTVTSLSLNGVFTSDYRYYTVRYAFSGSANADLYLRLRASGTDNTGANYYSGGRVVFVNAAVADFYQNGQTEYFMNSFINDAGQWQSGTIELSNPQVAEVTGIQRNSTVRSSTNGIGMAISAGVHQISSSYDGFSFIPGSGNISGTVQVFGWND